MIIVSQLGKLYENQGASRVQALEDVSFTIEQGEYVVIKGPSGSGKTTLLQLLGGLMNPSVGKVLVAGKNIAHFSEKELSRYRGEKVGFIFQDFNLINHLSVLDNVMVPALFRGTASEEDRKKALHLLALVGLEEKAEDSPVFLSGGQKQRVAIARALLRNPEIILADEPTGNLDAETGLQIETLLHRISKEYQVTILLVTHDEKVASLATRLLVIREGKLAENKVLT